MATQYTCVGFLELGTIAHGIQVTDGLLKKATIKILFAHPVSSGKYLICYYGEVEDVKSALAAGREIGGPAVLDTFVLTAIHPQIIPAVMGTVQAEHLGALGILETVTCASCIVAADTALKMSKIRLVKIQLARGIGGKAYFVIEGDVAEVNVAMAAAVRQLQKQGAGIIDQVVIPQAAPELLSVFQ